MLASIPGRLQRASGENEGRQACDETLPACKKTYTPHGELPRMKGAKHAKGKVLRP